MKIAILGSGWYGCHIANILRHKDIEFIIIDKNSEIFDGSSRRGQNRLHLGFHYPRCAATIKQTIYGFDKFIHQYGFLTKEVNENLYLISKSESYLNYDLYKNIMITSGLEFLEVTNQYKDIFTNCSGVIRVQEKQILTEKAKNYFAEQFSSHFQGNTYVDKSILKQLRKDFDLIIDCSWGSISKHLYNDLFFEPCIYFYYREKNNNNRAITVMDGPFFSIYPYNKDIVTVTSVKETPIARCKSNEESVEKIKYFSKKDIEEKQVLFEAEILKNYPGFKNDYEYVSHEFSIKSKIESDIASRYSFINQDGNLLSIFSGKIDSIYSVEKQLLSLLKSF
tara:strand:+ start:74 stop:1084 length:1011 start_codon:yes stop_codon:yes gene_type:complete